MAHVDIAVNEVRDPALAVRLENEIQEAAADAEEPDNGVIGFSIFDEGRHVDIQMELAGWVEHCEVSSSPRPGDVRRVVERFLGELGLR
jgi:hypothetical protein